MTYIVGLPLLAVAAVLQASVFSRMLVFGGAPDLVLMLTLSWTLAGEWNGGIGWGMLGGLLLDLLSGAPIGGSSLALIAVAYLAGLTEGRFWRSHFLLPLASVVLATMVFHFILLTVLAVSGYPVAWLTSLAGITLPTLLLNILCMLPIYHALRWLNNFINPAPVSI